MKRFLTAYLSTIAIIVALGCGNVDDENNGSSEAPTDGCFYSCNTAFGPSYGCSFGSEVTDASSCTAKADEQCSGDAASDELVTDCACQSSCAPGWWEGTE